MKGIVLYLSDSKGKATQSKLEYWPNEINREKNAYSTLPDSFQIIIEKIMRLFVF